MKFFSKKFLGAILMLSLPLAIGFAVAAIAQETEPATSNFKFQATWPTSPMGTDIMGEENPTLAVGIKYLYEWGVGLGGVAVFIALIMAGFEYITSIGNPSKMQDAFNRIRDAVIGLVILLSSYAVLNVVGINLKELKIDVFKPDPMDTLTTNCTSEKGQPAPDCCKMENGEKKTGCNDADWTCVGASASANKSGYCQSNVNKAECGKIILTFDNENQTTIEGTEEQQIDPGKTLKSMVKYTTKNEKCYDPGSTDANDPSKNPACSCGVQLFTKTMVAGSESVNSKKCGNVYVQIVFENKGLELFSNSSDIVCVMMTK